MTITTIFFYTLLYISVVKDQVTHTPLLRGVHDGNLYWLSRNSSPHIHVAEKVSIGLWHKCLDHPSEGVIRRLISSSSLSLSSSIFNKCVSCLVGKTRDSIYLLLFLKVLSHWTLFIVMFEIWLLFFHFMVIDILFCSSMIILVIFDFFQPKINLMCFLYLWIFKNKLNANLTQLSRHSNLISKENIKP